MVRPMKTADAQKFQSVAERVCRSVSFEVVPSELAEFLASKTPEAVDVEALELEALALTFACSRGSAKAIDQFAQQYRAPLRARLVATFGDSSAAEDACQEAIAHVLFSKGGARAKIAEYSGRGELLMWLSVVAVRLAKDRRRNFDDRPTLGPEVLLELPARSGPDLALASARHQLREALNIALQRISDRDRSILRLNALEGLTLDELAQLYSVHRATLARWLAAARATIFAHTKAHLLGPLQLTESVAESVLALAPQELEASFSALYEAQGIK